MTLALRILEIVGQVAAVLSLWLVGTTRRDLSKLPGWLRFFQGGLAALDRSGSIPPPIAEDTTPSGRRGARRRLRTAPGGVWPLPGKPPSSDGGKP